MSKDHNHPTFSEAFRFWLKLGFISFGGPTGQIAIMHTELVDKKKWITEERFLHALNYCMLLPGPEAQQLAIYIGWLLHRTWGGIVAGALFVIPSMFILWTLSYIYAAYGKIAWIASIFYGLKPAVMAIVAFAVIRIGSKVLKNGVMWSIAAFAFIAIYFFHAPFPLIIIGAGFIGFLGGKYWQEKFSVLKGHQELEASSEVAFSHTMPTWGRSLKVLLACLALWFTPLILIFSWVGADSIWFQEGIFFSKASLITFGGAYAVLPYVAQEAVQKFQWLNAAQMMDGLGLAETTPGPLIMVLQFVGFMGGWNHSAGISPLLSASIGAFITTWTTFVPCFLWILLGAPYIEQLRGNLKLSNILSAITAAVVGVILNLAVWFSVHTIAPEVTIFSAKTTDFIVARNIEAFPVIVAPLAFLALWKKWNMILVIFICGALGLIYKSLL
jgi:chromate transporter